MQLLPVSGHTVAFRQLLGEDDLFLLETHLSGVDLSLAFAMRLLDAVEASIDWPGLPLTDLDALLLLLRQSVLGNTIRTDAVCPAPACGSRIDIVFTVSDYLAYHRPRIPRNVRAGGNGWYQLRDDTASFRTPTVRDLQSIARSEQPERELVRRCVRPDDLPSGTLARVERALASISPNLSGDVQGICPECGVAVTLFFDPQRYTLQELRTRARFIYDEVHLLASSYHWSQGEILALPSGRRSHYAEMVRQHRSVA